MHAFSLQQFWINGLLVIPAACAVWLVCRVLPLRAATRHALWLVVLALLVLPTIALSIVPAERVRLAMVSLDSALGSKHAHQSAVRERQADEHMNAPATATLEEPDQPDRAREPAGSPAALQPFPSSQRTIYDPPLLETSQDERPIDLGPAVLHRNSSALVSAPPLPAGIEADHAAPPPRLEWRGQQRDRSEGALHSTSTLSDAPVREPDDSASAAPATETRAALEAPSEFERPVTTAGASPAWGAWLNSWLTQAGVLRDAFVRLPALPVRAWLTGGGLIALIIVLRLLHMQRIVSAASPAPSQIESLVRRASRRIGLGASPETRITTADISPMVWCIRRPVLVLPARLWSQLDDASRLAIVFHELAHLRRRDHWLCWVEMVCGVVFWWNPAVWWACRQVRDEADACCDAWVVGLQPTGRRAYAQALLASTQMNGRVAFAGPAVGLGALSPRTRRFARRLTMVMTEHMRPGLSLRGAAAVLAFAAATALVAPLAACPPEDAATAESAKQTKTTEVKQKQKKAEEAQPADSTYEEFMRTREQPSSNAAQEALSIYTTATRTHNVAVADDDVDARLDRLEQRLDKIAAALEALLSGGQATIATPQAPATLYRSGGGGAGVGAGPFVSGGGTGAGGGYTVIDQPATAGGYQPGAMVQGGAVAGADDVITRTYSLPEGKLKELTDLMVRQDVPILVTPRVEESLIDVHATPGNHEIFAAFLTLIHPEGVKVRQQAPAMTPAQPKQSGARSDLIEHRDALQQKKFVLIQQLGQTVAQAAQCEFNAEALEEELEALEEQIETLAEKAAEAQGAEGQRAARQALNDQSRAFRERIRDIEQARREMEKAQSEFERDSEAIEEAIEQIEEEIETLEELAAAGNAR